MNGTQRFVSRLCVADDVACGATRHTKAEEETSPIPTLVIPRRGVFEYRSGRSSVVADPNTVLLFDPDRPHRIVHPTDDGDDCTALRFSRQQIDEAFGRSETATRYWILDGDSQIALHLAMHRIRNAADPLEGEEGAMTILRVLSRAALQPSVHRAVSLVRERIAANPGERATLAELADGSGLSPFELARRFRSITGSSIHQYRLRLRILVALTRLQEGEDDITTLALDLGFASHAHFTSTFARTLKRPPRAFRGFNRAVNPCS